ncbi:MAG: aldo/keto reductase family protein [Planctomycetota bacterium]
MQYQRLGGSGLRVSRISLGSWLTIGNAVEQAASDALVRHAVDRGINLLDTADVYNDGEGELALGRAIKGLRRDRLVIASKCYFPMSDDPNDCGLSRKHIVQSIEASLQRLGLDYLDLYQCHRPDPDTPIEETAMAMDDLIRQGKTLYWGVSYWPARLIVQAVQFCRAHSFHAPVSNQPPYSLLRRDLEDEVMDAAWECGVGQIVFSPLAQGVLTGKYRPGAAPPKESRAADDRANRFIGAYLTEENVARVESLRDIAAQAGVTPAQLALAWCLRRPEVNSVIVGARTTAQLDDNLGALEVGLGPDVQAALDRAFPGATPRDTAT